MNGNEPQVSVMMPVYNAEQYIGEAIHSLLSQVHQNWELIIINDGSTDKTEEVIKQFYDPRIRVFYQPNSGEAIARNNALKRARGEFLAFLDADDAYLPNHLEITSNYLQANNDCDGVYTDGYYWDQNGNVMKTLSSQRRGPFEGDIFGEVIYSSAVFGPPVCVVLRNKLIFQHQLEFDQGIVMGPDWDFLTRFSEYGRFGYIDKETCLYRVHPMNVTTRTSYQKRALSLARCREKAIKLKGFNTCPLLIRKYAFYDLLVVLLKGYPERQSAITEWPEFKELPNKEQAEIFRLMASTALLSGFCENQIGDWLTHSRILNPNDRRSILLLSLYNLNPQICQLILRIKNLAPIPGPKILY